MEKANNIEWEYLGNNVYGQKVFSNKKGARKLVLDGKDYFETQGKNPFDFCRIRNEKHYDVLLQACLHTNLLASYQDNAIKLFSTFFETNEPKKHVRFQHFLSTLKRNRQVNLLSNWRNQLSQNLTETTLQRVALMENKTGFPLGVQIGLGNFFSSRKEEVLELGLSEDIDTGLLPRVDRIVYAEQRTYYPFSPKSTTISLNEIEVGLQKLSGKTVQSQPAIQRGFSFGFNSNRAVDSQKELSPELIEKLQDKNVAKILWGRFGELLERYPEHKFIYIAKQSKDEEQERIFSAKARSQYKSCQRWVLHGLDDEVVAVVWFVNWHKTDASKNLSLMDFCGLKVKIEPKNHHTQSGRSLYQAVSKSNEPTGVISNKIAFEVQQAIENIKTQQGNIDKWIAKLLKVSQEELFERLTAEQIDAVALGVDSLLKNKGLVIADETGFGKGRILASLTVIGHYLGKTILFFTENKQLFSDFYRDILAIKPDGLLPLVLNQSANLYNPQGELILKSLSVKKFKEMIETKTWDKNEPRFVLTNYSQINNKGTEQPKMDFLSRLMGDDCWILLDESHNASGNSNINENLKVLLKKSTGVVFSSATYAKTEEKLELYDKVLPLSDVAKRLVKLSLSGDNGELREMLTKEMAKQGNFIRREHPPIELPEVKFVDSPETAKRIEMFAEMWNKILTLAQYRERMLGYFNEKAWATIGGALSQSIREFNMFSKIEALTDLVEQKLNENKKIVIATEMTCESNLAQMLKGEFDFNDDGDVEELKDGEVEEKLTEKIFNEKPLWCWKWLNLLDSLEKNEEKELAIQKNNPEFSLEHYMSMKKGYADLKQEAEREILKNTYFSLSPFDELIERLKLKNISIGELSGRSHRLYQLPTGEWKIDNKLPKEERTAIVYGFNNQTDKNALIVTRAGATGISLHAGAKFLDQRQRHFVEWTIASNSAIRLQFLGRVRRRDQVIEPEFSTLLLKTPSDIRKWEVEKRKQIILSAHTGGRKDNQVLDWISEEGNLIIKEWASRNIDYAKRIGVYSTPDISKALNRSMILPLDVQQDLFDYVEAGIKTHTDYYFFRQRELPVSRLLSSEPLWGNVNTILESERDYSPMNLGYITKNFRQWKLSVDSTAKDKHLPVEQERFNHFVGWFRTGEDNPQLTRIANAVASLQLKSGKPFYWYNGLYRLKGVMLDVGYNGYLSLNTAYVKVLFERESEPVNIPLVYFFYNRDFKLDCPSDQFSQNDFVITQTVEGNPILMSAWNKKMQKGEIRTIYDLKEGDKTALLLEDVSIEHIPFVEVGQLKDVLFEYQKNTEENFGVKDKTGKITLKMVKTDKGTAYQVIYSTYGLYKQHQNGWVKKAVKFIRDKNFEDGVMTLTIPYKFFYHAISLMEDDGVHFFLTAEDKDLFDRTVKRYIPNS